MEQVKQPDEKFCFECGEKIRARAEICPKCGVRQPPIAGQGMGAAVGQGTRRTKGMAAVCGILLGGIGLHKFYLGKPFWGIIYIALCWTLIPAIIGFFEGLSYLFMSQELFDTRYNGGAWVANPT